MRLWISAACLLVLWGCGGTDPSAVEVELPDSPKDNFPPPVVAKSFLDSVGNLIIEDAMLEAALRDVSGVAEGALSPDSLARFQTLTLNGRNIRDIRPLSELPFIKNLNLTGNQIEDISPLASLSGIEELWLGQNSISSIEPLGEMTGLRLLEIHGNQIKDVSALAGLRQLERLNLWKNEVTKLDALSG